MLWTSPPSHRFRVIERLARRLRGGAGVRVFVPSHDRHGRAIDHGRFCEVLQEVFTEVGGGSTTFPGVGSWSGADGSLAQEPVSIVECFLPRTMCSQAREAILDCLEYLLIVGDQEALAVNVGGELFLIPGLRFRRTESKSEGVLLGMAQVKAARQDR
jgi:hypothetical protein